MQKVMRRDEDDERRKNQTAVILFRRVKVFKRRCVSLSKRN